MARKKSPELHPLAVLTRRELASWLKKSERTIDRLRPPQILPGRYLIQDVIAFLHSQQKAAS